MANNKGVSTVGEALFVFFSRNTNIMRNRLYKKIILAVFVISFFAVPNSAVLAANITSKSVIELANKARAKAGLPTLVENDKLSAAARDKVKDMVKEDYFAHTSPAGKTPWDWLKQNEYKYKYAGENLAMNYDSAEEQQAAWMKSQSHRANILNGNYQEIGVAVLNGKVADSETLLTVEFFGTAFQGAAIPGKKESIITEEEKTVAVKSAEPASVPISEPKYNPAPAKIIKSQAAVPVPPAIQTAGKKDIAEFLNIAWMAAFLVLGFSVIAGPLAIAVKALKDAVAVWKGVPVQPQTFAIVIVSQQDEILKNFWQDMQKTS